MKQEEITTNISPRSFPSKRGEQTANALERNLTSLEQKIDALLASVEGQSQVSEGGGNAAAETTSKRLDTSGGDSEDGSRGAEDGVGSKLQEDTSGSIQERKLRGEK